MVTEPRESYLNGRGLKGATDGLGAGTPGLPAFPLLKLPRSGGRRLSGRPFEVEAFPSEEAHEFALACLEVLDLAVGAAGL